MAGSFQDLLVELFDTVGGVSFRKMFGGIGIFRQGIMFALVADDTLYLKADEVSAIDFKAEGSGPFIYDGKTKPHVMPYWRLPERLYDEPGEFRHWALNAFAAAERVKEENPRKKARARKRKTNA
jgi:DNA transformation protein and related proteins